MKRAIPYFSILISNILIVMYLINKDWDLISLVLIYFLENSLLYLLYVGEVLLRKQKINKVLHLFNIYLNRKQFIAMYGLSLFFHAVFSTIFILLINNYTMSLEVNIDSFIPFGFIALNYAVTISYNYIVNKPEEIIDPIQLYKRMFVLHLIIIIGMGIYGFSAYNLVLTISGIILIKCLFELNLHRGYTSALKKSYFL